MMPASPLTGRKVALMFLGFFAVVSGVNFVMIRAAVSTFAGLETKNSYQAGLIYEREIVAAAQQNERHWTVEANLRTTADGPTSVFILARDRAGTPLSGLESEVRFIHPASSRRDVVLTAKETGAGLYQATVDDIHGNWTLDLILARDGKRLFRSTSRVTLQ